MKTPQSLIAAVVAFGILTACSKSADPSSTSMVTLSMTGSTSTGKPNINGRFLADSANVTLTDVMVNIRDIKFDFEKHDGHDDHDSDSSGHHHDGDNNDDQYDSTGYDGQDSAYVDNDPKLVGPFIVDLMNAGSFVDQVIAQVNLPNASFEKVSFKLVPSKESGDMNGKSIRITGTIGGTPFEFWHHRDTRFGAKLSDSTALTTNGAAVSLAIQFELDKILSAANGGVDLSAAADRNGDGTIMIDPLNDDGNKWLADRIMNLLVRHTHCHRDHHD